MIDLLINIKNFVINLVFTISRFCKNTILGVPKFFKEIEVIKDKLNNLEATNFEVAMHHLYLGRINDAIFRLKIINNFIEKDGPKSHYWLGWCYFLTKKYDKSIEHLEKGATLDINNLMNFLKSCDSIEEIPERIYDEYKNLMWNKSSYQELNLHSKIIKALLQLIGTIPTQCEILDLGCNVGASAKAINLHVPKNYKLTGVDGSYNAISYIQKTKIVYDKIHVAPIKKYLLDNCDNYDIIISVNSLNFSKRLEEYVAETSSMLNTNGYFVLVLEEGTEIKINDKRNGFVYTQNYVQDSLEQANCKILLFSRLRFDENYLLFICTNVANIQV